MPGKFGVPDSNRPGPDANARQLAIDTVTTDPQRLRFVASGQVTQADAGRTAQMLVSCCGVGDQTGTARERNRYHSGGLRSIDDQR